MQNNPKPQLEIKNLTIRYSSLIAVDQVSFRLNRGEIGCLLGPSGCGKTTILRAIAGFEKPLSGEIYLHEQAMNPPNRACVPTEKRQIGMVFQDLALFPHLSVTGNIEFGLQALSKNIRKNRVIELLELIGLTHSATKFPHELSGGQQQRVAIARAIAPKPQILLLDEPFSNIDIEFREQLARDIRKIIHGEKITTLLVTHDQLEAFAMADQIGVIQNGHLHQWDTGFNLYHKPKDLFVADFIGRGTLIDATVYDTTHVQTELGLIGQGHLQGNLQSGDKISVLIRPDDIIHDDNSTMTAEIIEKNFRGAEFLYRLKLPTGGEVLCFAPSHHNHKLHENIGIRLEIDHLVVFKKETL